MVIDVEKDEEQTQLTRGSSPESDEGAGRAQKQHDKGQGIASIIASHTKDRFNEVLKSVMAATTNATAFVDAVGGSPSSTALRIKANMLRELANAREKQEKREKAMPVYPANEPKKHSPKIAFLPSPGGAWSQNSKGYFDKMDVEHSTHVLVHIMKTNNDGSVIIQCQDLEYKGDDKEKMSKQVQLEAAKAKTLCYNPSFVGKMVRMKKGNARIGEVVEDAVEATGKDTDTLMVKWKTKIRKAQLGDIDIVREEEAALRLGVIVQTRFDKGSTPAGWQGIVTTISNKQIVVNVCVDGEPKNIKLQPPDVKVIEATSEPKDNTYAPNFVKGKYIKIKSKDPKLNKKVGKVQQIESGDMHVRLEFEERGPDREILSREVRIPFKSSEFEILDDTKAAFKGVNVTTKRTRTAHASKANVKKRRTDNDDEDASGKDST